MGRGEGKEVITLLKKKAGPRSSHDQEKGGVHGLLNQWRKKESFNLLGGERGMSISSPRATVHDPCRGGGRGLGGGKERGDDVVWLTVTGSYKMFQRVSEKKRGGGGGGRGGDTVVFLESKHWEGRKRRGRMWEVTGVRSCGAQQVGEQHSTG